ncbi:MAG TPA: phage tail protein [Deltaproteobacteria bacterium]|nr:phage tail protein [Deltaproteobacteria bacterium]
MADEASNRDPFGNYYFALEINKTQVAHFQEFSGLKTSSQVFEIEEGGMNGMTHKRPGQSRYENIVLKYATNATQTLLEWRDKYLRDNFTAQKEDSGAVIVYDNSGTEVRRYSFTRAWPVSWEGPALSAGSSEIAVETVEIAFDGLYVK